MTRFEVQSAFLDRYQVHQVGGRDVVEYWIPAEKLADLKMPTSSARSPRKPTAAALWAMRSSPRPNTRWAEPLPAAWRDYLQGSSWFRRGWMMISGVYVWLNTPREMLDLHDAWDRHRRTPRDRDHRR